MKRSLQGDFTVIIVNSVLNIFEFRSDHLARHTKMHLQQDKRHVCTECGRAFNRLDNLKAHQRIHTGIKDNIRLHLCVYCGKEFNNSSNMVSVGSLKTIILAADKALCLLKLSLK